jgi:hypothetical protein
MTGGIHSAASAIVGAFFVSEPVSMSSPVIPSARPPAPADRSRRFPSGRPASAATRSGALTGYHWGMPRKRAILGWETGISARG